MHRIAVIPGDGIGPEVIEQGIRVLTRISQKLGISIEFTSFPWGADYYFKTGEVLPPDGLKQISQYDAVYVGAVGDPRAPRGLLERAIIGGLRWDMDLYVNLRPMKLYNEQYCPLKKIVPSDLDILVVRENTEDLYTGPSGFIKKNTDDEVGFGTAFYTKKGVERVIRYAYDQARKRKKKKLTLCDKANAVQAQEIWRRVFSLVGQDYPDVEQETIYVDACAMALVRKPQQFDVIVTTNLFGDILTDLGAELCGGVGLAPSGNIHPGRFGFFEPIHGSAPKYAGKKKANPLGAILAGGMMLEYLGADAGPASSPQGETKKGGLAIESAVAKLLRTGTLKTLGTESELSTDQIGDLVLEQIESYDSPIQSF
jgi:3-isopropylmalate dehydrogenase